MSLVVANTPARCRAIPCDRDCGACLFAHARPEAIELVVCLVLDRTEAAALLASISGESGVEAVRPGCVAEQLARAARQSDVAARAVAHAVDARLGAALAAFEGRSCFELATDWVARRGRRHGLEAAALLWTVVRAGELCFRALESRLVEEIRYEAARSLAATT